MPQPSLRALAPTPLPPVEVHRRSPVLRRLQGIRRITVLGRFPSTATTTTTATFRVAITYGHQQHATGHRNSRIPVHKSDPETILERPLGQFITLRDELFFRASTGHLDSPSCDFCRRAVAYAIAGRAQPRMTTTWFRGERAVCDILTAFLEDVLAIVRSSPQAIDDTTTADSVCGGRRHIPQALMRFLAPRGEHV